MSDQSHPDESGISGISKEEQERLFRAYTRVPDPELDIVRHKLAKETGIHVNHFVLKNRDALAQWVKVELDEDESPNPNRTISRMAKNIDWDSFPDRRIRVLWLALQADPSNKAETARDITGELPGHDKEADSLLSRLRRYLKRGELPPLPGTNS